MKISEKEYLEAVDKIGSQTVERVIRAYVDQLRMARPAGVIKQGADVGIYFQPSIPWKEFPVGVTLYLAPLPVEDTYRTFEFYNAIKGGHRINVADKYFEARPHIVDSGAEKRALFEAGFDRGYDVANKLYPGTE